MADAKKGSMLGTLIPILVLTVAAGGGGALIGTQIAAVARSAAEKAAGGPESQKPASAPIASNQALRELVPIVTNLAFPEGISIRLQTAIVYDKTDAPQIDVIATKIGEDVLAFVRTLTLAQIQGSSGLQALRDDLNERAVVRSDGKVRELLIEMLVVR